MALETATYISQLVATNPVGGDDLSTADDHLRLIKAILQAQFPNFIAAAMNATVAELNKLAGYPGAIPAYTIAGDWTSQQAFTPVALTDAPSIVWDVDTRQIATVTLAANRTLANPTNPKQGGVYTLKVKQDPTGGRTLAYGSAYLFPGGVDPVLSAGGNAEDILNFIYIGTSMYGIFSGDFK